MSNSDHNSNSDLPVDIHWMTLLALNEAMTSKQLSPLEATAQMLARIELTDPAIGSYAEVTDDRAFVSARQAQAEIARGELRGPLHGVPIAVKALCEVAGETYGAGMSIFAERKGRKNATVVRRLEAAGAILLGTLTMTEGASAVHHPSIRAPLNPWDGQAWTGASSSGSGAAVAAGLCFGALGSDTAGSIRVPSHFCGVVGLKPTYGRVSRAGVFPLSATLDHVGPMARTVADCAAILGVIAGADPRDPSAVRQPVPDYLAAIDSSLKGFRIGIDDTYNTAGVDDELARAIAQACNELKALGATIVPIKLPPLDGPLLAGAHILHADVAHAHAPYFLEHEEHYGPHLSEIIKIGQGLTGVDIANAHDLRRTWKGQLAQTFEHVDAIMCPPSAAAAPPAQLTQALSGNFVEQARHFRFTLPYTLSGHPCLTVPCGVNTHGLPLAFQLVGTQFGEAGLLQAGHQYQTQTNWHHRHPCA